MKKFRSLAVTVSALIGISSMLVACGEAEPSTTLPRSDAEQGSGRGAGASAVDGTSGSAASAKNGAASKSADGETLGGEGVAEPVTTVTPLAFAAEVAEKICRSYASCCFGDATTADNAAVDAGASGAGHYDQAACIDTYVSRGFEGSALGITAIETGIAVDATKRADCLSKLDTLSCSLSGTELAAARASCYEAIVGQLPLGSTCRVSLQCASGSFCKTGLEVGAGGGEMGVCTALRTAGQPCGDVVVSSSIARDSIDSEVACSSRGSGDTGLACSSFDTVTGSYKTDRSTWTCQPTVAAGEICNTNVSCGGGLCDPGADESKYRCEPTMSYFSVAGCGFFIKP